MFFHSQPIFQPGSQPFQHCHAASLVEIPGGHPAAGDGLLEAWFGSAHVGHADVAIWLACSQAGQWGAPVKIAAVPGVPLWNLVLFSDRAGTLWLFYKIGPTIPAWTGAYIRSTDNGWHWSRPASVGKRSGRVFLPGYHPDLRQINPRGLYPPAYHHPARGGGCGMDR